MKRGRMTVGLAVAMAVGSTLLTSSGAVAQGEREGWLTDFAKAQEAAKASGKLILVDVWADW